MPAPAAPSGVHATEIALAGMRFHVRIGVLPHERELPQPLEVDLRVRLVRGSSAVLDYRTLHALVRGATDAGPLSWLEDVARTVVSGALALPDVAWARVVVRKPHVMLDGPLAWAEVAMEGGDG